MYNEAIRKGVKEKSKKQDIIRKVYLSYPTNAFKDKPDLEFNIFNKVSEFFSVPYNSVQVVGSAKTGESYHKKRLFIPQESDLDIAIISDNLFLNYMQNVFKETKGYTDLTNFPQYNQYTKYISKGIFRPDLMPRSKIKNEWFGFFNGLSNEYYTLFKNINAGIYLNQTFFEFKQLDIIDKHFDF